MKQVIKKIVLLLILFSPLIPQALCAETKTFIKEYTYQAGDEDSKNSSRVIALREVKRLLLEELGTYLESTTEVQNFKLTRDQIVTLTAGIVQTELLDEKWDGKTYRLKAKISANSDSVVRSIDALRKDRDKTKELEAMRQKSDELMREVEKLRREMAAKHDDREGQKAAYDQSIRKLSAAEWIERGHAVSGPDDKFKGAISAYSRAIELDPTNIKAYYFRARISGDKNQAMSDYYKILSIEAKTSEEHLIRAWTYKELDQRDSAFQEFGKAIEKAGNNKEKAEAYADRARYYTLFRPRPYAEPSAQKIPNALELSIRDYDQAIALDSNDPSYFHNRANSYLGLGRYDEAIADLSEGLRINPKSAGLYSARGQAYQFLKKYELAVADLSRAIELEGPDDLFASHDFMLRAFNYEKLRKYDLAIADWSALLNKKPDDRFYIKQRADLYVKAGKYDQAIKGYVKVLTLKPENYEIAAVYYGRAQAYGFKGQPQEAIQDLARVVKMDPGYKKMILSDAAFTLLRQHPDFIRLTGK
ncbi:MAG TPA: tetratricopeptide repeat protein [Smithellaceae bacterium]|nr:tetratricopeptide repeat protein [Smithellaceae bacterium]